MSYSALDRHKKQIRLVHLAPKTSFQRKNSAPEDPTTEGASPPHQAAAKAEWEISDIRCTFELALLDENLEYEALSYVWGNAEELDKVPIVVDNKPFNVTKNLYNALRDLQLEDRERCLWIDALCINQDDTDERTHQVNMMGEVFSYASCVIVWLGKEWPGSDIAIEFFDLWGNNVHLHFDASAGPCAEVNGMNLSSAILRRHLIQFLSRPWWTRVWTIQEYALSRSVVFQSGQRTLRGEILYEWVNTLARHIENSCCIKAYPLLHEDDDETGLDLNSLVGRLFALHTLKYGEIDEHFSLILGAYRDRQCTDPRDKIYGMLGLANHVYRDFIKPDYALSAEEVFTTTTLAIIEITHSLDVLTLVYGDRNLRKLPSFVPDWTISSFSSSDLVNYANRMQILPEYDACGGRVGDMKLITAQKATTTGIIFDSIVAVGLPSSGGSSWHCVESWRNMARADDDANTLHSYLNQSEAHSTVFWQVLCGGLMLGPGGDHIVKVDVTIGYQRYCRWKIWLATPLNSVEEASAWDSDVRYFDEISRTMMIGRRFIITEKGYFGLAPADTAVGDFVAILSGGCVPYVLRAASGSDSSEHGIRNSVERTIHGKGGKRLFSTSVKRLRQKWSSLARRPMVPVNPPSKSFISASQFRFLGDAYVHGVMNGELCENGPDFTEITLI